MSVPITKVLIGAEEERLVIEVLRSGMLAQGEKVAALEEAFSAAHQVAHTVAVSNGTVALTAALRALGIGPGDEVITTSFSCNATLHGIIEAGATVRFADIRDDFTVDPDGMAALINARTAALLPVHLYGLPADMDAITALADRHGLVVIEDAAQAAGASFRGRRVGTFGVGAFSLYGTKSITAGEGGLVTTDDDEVARKLRLLRNHGTRARYDYQMPGCNWRLTDLQAAVALPQVQRLEKVLAARAGNAAALSAGLDGLPGVILPPTPDGRSHGWHQYTVQVTEVGRDDFCSRLTAADVGYGIYYPRLMYDWPCYGDCPQVIADDTPNARRIATRVVSLPVHPGLDETDLRQVITAVRGACGA